MSEDMSDYSTNYAVKIRRYLDAQNIDFHELALKADLPETEIRDLALGDEDEIYSIDIDILFKILKCMNYSIYELFGEDVLLLNYQNDFLAKMIIYIRDNNLSISAFEDSAGWSIEYLFRSDVKKLICLDMIVDVCEFPGLNWKQIMYALNRFGETS